MPQMLFLICWIKNRCAGVAKTCFEPKSNAQLSQILTFSCVVIKKYLKHIFKKYFNPANLDGAYLQAISTRRCIATGPR